jgi:serine/threonine-protein kinase HipA
MTADFRALDVLLHGDLIGRIDWSGVTSRFEFDSSYHRAQDRFVLGLAFEENLTVPYYGHERLPVWFTNLLPEGQLRRLVSADLGLPLTARQSLLDEVAMGAAIGKDMVGAVQLVPTQGDEAGGQIWSEPEGQPVRALELNDQRLHFSLAGMGLKFSMIEDGERFTAPASGFGGDWIVKLPDQVFERVPQNEHAMMSLASEVGIDVPDVRLIHRDAVQELPDKMWANEEYAYAIRRFDRAGDRSPIHIEDLAQVRGVIPDSRYFGSFETVAKLFYRGRDSQALTEFVRRLAFNLLVGNSDAHLKNWSLIYPDRRKPTISPAYDIVSVVAYNRPNLVKDSGLRFGGHKRYVDMRLSYFDRLGRKVGVEGLGDVASKMVTDVESLLGSALLGLPETLSRRISEHFADTAAALRRTDHPNY